MARLKKGLLIAALLGAIVLSADLSAKNKDVDVSGYTRKDGTQVEAYQRSSPGESGRSTTDDSGIYFAVTLLGIAFVCGLIVLIAKKLKTGKGRHPATNTLEQQAKAYLDKINSMGAVAAVDSVVLVAGDERACLEESSELYEARSSRVYGGAGTRIKGIYVGGGSSTSVEGIQRIDFGRLTLTNRRIVFTGTMESRSIELKNLAAIIPYADAIQLTSSRRMKNQIYTVANPFIWCALVERALRGTLRIEDAEAIQRRMEAESATQDINFDCPQCGQSIEGPAALAGQMVNCPTCKTAFAVPA